MTTYDQRGQHVETQYNVAGNLFIDKVEVVLPAPADAADRRNLAILLQKVKTFWIAGVLDKSIHTAALLELGKQVETGAVEHPWERVLELPDQTSQPLPAKEKISAIFEQMNRAMLILGEPGSGKTITLLELARELIAQVEATGDFRQPAPVVFNLSSWQKGQSLLDWLVAELSAKYQIPKKIGCRWLEENRLLPLLDGLDEVQADDRTACVEAINVFGQEHGLSGLVVCSRLAEYTALPARLKLNGAIRLQPLTPEQVDDYLTQAGPQLDTLRESLQEDEPMRELAQSPLMLNIMSLAYQDGAMQPEQSLESVAARRRHLFGAYIERMFKRKGERTQPYADEQTLNWLTWLAQEMQRRHQTIFLIERLQPSWLAKRSWRWLYALGSRLTSGLVAGLMVGLMIGVSGARAFRLDAPFELGAAGWLLFGLPWGLMIGLLWGLVDGIRFESGRNDIKTGHTPTRRQQAGNVLVIGLILMAASGLLIGPFAGLSFALFGGLLFGLLAGLFVGIRGSRQSRDYDIQTVEALRWSWKKALKRVRVGLVGGAVFGLMLGWVIGLNQELVASLEHGPLLAQLGEQGFIVGVAVFWGVFGGTLAAMFGGLGSEMIAAKTRANQGIWLSLSNALLTGPLFGIITGLVTGLTRGLLFGFWKGVEHGLMNALFVGTVAALWYGGLDIIQHLTLRLILWRNGHIPWNYACFLDYAAERVFLQKVGGGYIFIHRLLLEHFAEMNGRLEGR